MTQVAQKLVHGRYQGSKGDEHGTDVEHKVNGHVCAIPGGFDDVVLRDRRELKVVVVLPVGLRIRSVPLDLLFSHASGRADEVGHKQRAWHRHHGGADELRGTDAHADVGGEHAPSDAREATHHHAMQVARAGLLEEGLDEQRRFGLPQEEVSRRVHRLDEARAHQLLQEDGYDSDDSLHHTNVVHGGYEGREEYGDRKHLESKKVLLEGTPEDEGTAYIRQVQEVGNRVPRILEERHANRGGQHEESEEELEQDGRNHLQPWDAAPVPRQQHTGRHEDARAKQGLCTEHLHAALAAIPVADLEDDDADHEGHQRPQDPDMDRPRYHGEALADLRQKPRLREHVARQAHGGEQRQWQRARRALEERHGDEEQPEGQERALLKREP
mmetsp:Transcript_65077/g.146767  ORF Transcript_65077/g.146767 Transcript_65077/m.146767 type:complete len:385 (+) Transcript_65077:501-1655(+)